VIVVPVIVVTFEWFDSDRKSFAGEESRPPQLHVLHRPGHVSRPGRGWHTPGAGRVLRRLCGNAKPSGQQEDGAAVAPADVRHPARAWTGVEAVGAERAAAVLTQRHSGRLDVLVVAFRAVHGWPPREPGNG